MGRKDFVKPNQIVSMMPAYRAIAKGFLAGAAVVYGLGSVIIYPSIKSELAKGKSEVQIENRIDERCNNLFLEVFADIFKPVRNLAYKTHERGQIKETERNPDIDGL